MIRNAIELLSRAYETFLGKVLILGLPIIAAPIVLLSMIASALGTK